MRIGHCIHAAKLIRSIGCTKTLKTLRSDFTNMAVFSEWRGRYSEKPFTAEVWKLLVSLEYPIGRFSFTA